MVPEKLISILSLPLPAQEGIGVGGGGHPNYKLSLGVEERSRVYRDKGEIDIERESDPVSHSLLN